MDNSTQTSTLLTTEQNGINPYESNFDNVASNSALNAKLNSLESKVKRLIQSTAITRHQHIDFEMQ